MESKKAKFQRKDIIAQAMFGAKIISINNNVNVHIYKDLRRFILHVGTNNPVKDIYL